MADPRELFDVEVVCALADAQHVVALKVPAGTTIRGTIERSRILEVCREIDLAINAVGIFGRRRAPEELVADGDRIEIYRPLLLDPKEARRRRGRGAQ